MLRGHGRHNGQWPYGDVKSKGLLAVPRQVVGVQMAVMLSPETNLRALESFIQSLALQMHDSKQAACDLWGQLRW